MSSFLVTGVGGPAGGNVSGLLLGRGHRLVGTDVRQISLPGIQFRLVPRANDPDFLASILTIAESLNINYIIPTVSEELPVFARGWMWAERFPVAVGSAQAVTIADDKYLTAQALSAAHVPVPRFVLPSQVRSAEDLARLIGWPCISKPRIGRGGREVAWHPEQDWPLIAALDDNSILQEFAPGTDFAPNVFIPKTGDGGCVVVIEKTELKQGIVGNARSVRRVEDVEVGNVALAAARAAGLTGALDIDIRRKANGQPVVLEINARFGANIRHAPEILEAFLKDL